MSLFSALVAILLGTAAPQSVTIPTNFTKVFYQEASQTRRTGVESFYCLQGSLIDGDFRVASVVKPWQVTSQSYTLTRYQSADSTWTTQTANSNVTYMPCPAGTVMDLHTHPFGTAIPSEVDVDTWRRITKYRLHGIMAQLPDGRVTLIVWDKSGKEVPRVRSAP
jgi:proteasome lid subunit RPN8/RPN11